LWPRCLVAGWVANTTIQVHVFASVLEGAITFTFDGKEPFTVKAGEIYHETPNEKMLAKNASASEGLKLIVFQVGTEG